MKRRRVFRALIGYGIVSFAVLQIIEPVMHGLNLPDWVLSATVVGLGIGFPFTLVLAWALDVKGGRIERTGPAPSARLLLILIAIGVALTKLSVTPAVAMILAQKFFEPQRGRKLGKPFDNGKTFMLVTTDGTASIINLEADQDISLFLQEATIVVDLGKIIATVNSRIPN